MGEAAKRRRDDQYAIVFQKPREFTNRRDRIGDMFEYLGAEYGVKACIGLGDSGDVADDIEFAVIPFGHLQTGGIIGWNVLGKVLRHISEMAAIAAVLLFSGPGVQKPRTGGKSGKLPANPFQTIGFVRRADGQCDGSWWRGSHSNYYRTSRRFC